jgi:hypothetical protein
MRVNENALILYHATIENKAGHGYFCRLRSAARSNFGETPRVCAIWRIAAVLASFVIWDRARSRNQSATARISSASSLVSPSYWSSHSAAISSAAIEGTGIYLTPLKFMYDDPRNGRCDACQAKSYHMVKI